MLTERTIINALILMATFILVPLIIAETVSSDFVPALVAGGILLAITAFFVLKERLVVLPMLGAYVYGTLNFLPLPVGAPHIFAALLIFYYVIAFVLLSQRPITLGRAVFFWPIILVTGIVIYHVHSLKLASAGGSTEGARPAFFIYLFTIAYFCGINLPTPSITFLRRIPFYAVCLTAISAVPYLLSTAFPRIAPYIYLITNNVNVEAYVTTEGGTQDVAFDDLTSKLAALGPLGATLQLYLVVHYPIATWFHPRRIWVGFVSLCCVALSVLCGYRSDLFGFFLLTLVGTCCYYSWRALLLPFVAVFGLVVLLTASDNKLIHLPLRSLPLIAQRTMSFLPGDWDQQAIDSGAGSNEFRQSIIDEYLLNYAHKAPLFGNGFDIDKEEFEYLKNQFDHGEGGDQALLQAKVYIEGKMFHTGWISVYDCVGIVGWIGFLGFQLALIFVTGSFIFGRKADRKAPLFPIYVWLMCNTFTAFASYYTVFGSFNQTYIDGLCYAILLSHLMKLRKQSELAAAPEVRKTPAEYSRIPQTSYGRKYT